MRRTEHDEQRWCVRGIPWEQLHKGAILAGKTAELLYGALWKLMEYEDTGLSPEEVVELKEFVAGLPMGPQWNDKKKVYATIREK